MKRGIHAIMREASGRVLSASIGTSAAIQLINVVTGIMIARTLGPEGRGELTAALLVPALLAAVGSLGLAEGVTYYTAKNRFGVGRVLGSALVLAGAISLVLVGIGLLLASVVLDHFGSVTVAAARLYVLFIPLSLCTLLIAGALNGLHRFAAFNVARLAQPALVVTGLIALVSTGTLEVTSAVVLYLVSEALTLLVAAVLLRRAEVTSLAVSKTVGAEVLWFGLKSHISTVSSVLNERIDQLIISLILTPVKLGLYVVAVTMTSLTSLIGYSVAFVALPSLARLPEGDERVRRARQYAFWTLVVALTVSVPIAIFASPLMSLLFGPEFLPAVEVARILLFAAVLLSLNRTLGAIVKAAGRPLIAGTAEMIGLVVTFVGLAALLPSLGLIGAGLASLLAYGTTLVWIAWRGRMELGL